MVKMGEKPLTYNFARAGQETLATRSRKGHWRMAGNSIVQRALNKQWLWKQGVPNMRQQWIDLHYGASAP